MMTVYFSFEAGLAGLVIDWVGVIRDELVRAMIVLKRQRSD